jgi:hypothetical protein
MKVELDIREIDHIRCSLADSVRVLRKAAFTDENLTTNAKLQTLNQAEGFDLILGKMNVYAAGEPLAYAGRDPQPPVNRGKR